MTKMKKAPIEQQRFEFSLLINNHIICQRYFDIKGYNESCKDSLEIREMMGDLVGMNINEIGDMGIIPRFLKNKSLEYLWSYYDPYREQNQEDVFNQNIHDKVDQFKFEVKVDGTTLVSSSFSGNPFPPKVKYNVNIKELIPDIISEIRYYLTKNSYTRQYGDIKLNRQNKMEKIK